MKKVVDPKDKEHLQCLQTERDQLIKRKEALEKDLRQLPKYLVLKQTEKDLEAAEEKFREWKKLISKEPECD